MNKMNILIASTCCAVTKPLMGYGGIERVVRDTVDVLHGLDHEITVAAPYGSEFPEGVHHFPTVRLPDQIWQENIMLERLAQQNMIPNGFDVIDDFSHQHTLARISHGYWAMQHPILNRIWHPPYFNGLPNRISEPAYNLCGLSESQAKGLKEIYNQEVKWAYLGINTEKYAFQRDKGDRYLWISVANREKGGIEAIQLCKKLGLKLDCLPATLQDFTPYMAQMKSMCDGEQIRWIEQLPESENVKYFQNAKALIAPIFQLEPFGLIFCEALSCGSPVFSMNWGAMPEIVTPECGCLANNIDEMETHLREFEAGNISFNPEKCRARVLEKFKREQMVERFLGLYDDVANLRFWY